MIDWQAMEQRANKRAIRMALILAGAQILAAIIVACLTATPGSFLREKFFPPPVAAPLPPAPISD